MGVILDKNWKYIVIEGHANAFTDCWPFIGCRNVIRWLSIGFASRVAHAMIQTNSDRLGKSAEQTCNDSMFAQSSVVCARNGPGMDQTRGVLKLVLPESGSWGNNDSNAKAKKGYLNVL